MARHRRPGTPGITIDPRLRALLIAGGVILIASGALGWVWPPKHTEFAPAATSAEAKARVSDPSETLSTALIAAGVLILLVGINGRKIASITVGGDELTFAEAVSKAAANTAKTEAAAKDLGPEQVNDATEIAAGKAFAAAINDPYTVDPDAIATEAVATAEGERQSAR